MNKNNGSKPILSAVVSSILFIVLTIILEWNFFVAALISILSYYSIVLLSNPVKKIGDTKIEKIEQGERIKRIYDNALTNIENMKKYSDDISDKYISEQSNRLQKKGEDILEYLTNNINYISSSEHFLDYYLMTGNKIIKNYLEIENSNISNDKKSLIYKETSESLSYLNEIFNRQLDSYYEDKILELELESDLLEKTVKLGGDRK